MRAHGVCSAVAARRGTGAARRGVVRAVAVAGRPGLGSVARLPRLAALLARVEAGHAFVRAAHLHLLRLDVLAVAVRGDARAFHQFLRCLREPAQVGRLVGHEAVVALATLFGEFEGEGFVRDVGRDVSTLGFCFLDFILHGVVEQFLVCCVREHVGLARLHPLRVSVGVDVLEPLREARRRVARLSCYLVRVAQGAAFEQVGNVAGDGRLLCVVVPRGLTCHTL